MDNELIELLAQWNAALAKLQESSERLTIAVTEYINKNKTNQNN